MKPFIVVAAVLCGACQSSGGLQLREVATVTAKPSHVATLVTVTEHGDSVMNLRSAAFRLSENDRVIEDQVADVRLIDPATVMAFHTVLLLDLGHGTSEDTRREFGRAADGFVRVLRQRQTVAVLGFDGSAKSRLLGDYPVDTTGMGPSDLAKSMPAPRDPSRNLHGAVVEGLERLDAMAKRSGRSVSTGTLVVFTRGPDVAGRVSIDEIERRLNQSGHRLVLVTLGNDPGQGELERLQRDGKIAASGTNQLVQAMDQAAAVVGKLAGKYYFLAYCSPARSGERRLRIEVSAVDDELRTQTEAIETRFDSTGFLPGCSSSNAPRFVLPKSRSVQ